MAQAAQPLDQSGNPPEPTGVRAALLLGRNTHYWAVASPLHHAKSLPERLSYLHDLLRELMQAFPDWKQKKHASPPAEADD